MTVGHRGSNRAAGAIRLCGDALRREGAFTAEEGRDSGKRLFHLFPRAQTSLRDPELMLFDKTTTKVVYLYHHALHRHPRTRMRVAIAVAPHSLSLRARSD